MPPRQMIPKFGRFFRLVGMLKYGIAFSALLVYLPFTTYPSMPLHGMLGNLFSELRPLSAFAAALFVFLAAWTVMIVMGLIVNGIELRFPRSTPGRAYRTFAQISEETPQRVLPRAVDQLFSVPVTIGQFVLYTLVLAGLAGVIMVLNARPGEWIWVLAAIALAFIVAYVLLIFAAAPAAILDRDDPPLRGAWPVAGWLWPCLGKTWFGAFARSVQWWCSRIARALHMDYILDDAGKIYPAHLLAAVAVAGFVVLWVFAGWAFYPARLGAASVASVYVGLLIFVWFFGGLSFHLGRLHISPLAAVALVLLVGYMKLDHRFQPAEPPSTAEPSIDPIDVAATAQTNLIVVATAGGGAWAAGWTARGLELLIANRPELRHEIRVISAVSGGSVGTAYFIDGVLRGGPATSSATILHDARVRSTASSLDVVAYGFAFRDFPRLLSGGFYNPYKDRGQLLEEEWARIAAAPIEGEHVGRRPQPKEGKRRLRSLNTSIREGVVPAPIFGTTVMEAGQRLMITPITFASDSARARTLQEFLFGTEAATPEPDVDLWTAARLSATFTYISPPARSWLDARPTQQEHLIDGGYYDNYGVTSALDWLTPVLWAKKNGDARLRFTRVLLIELSGFAEPAEIAKPADGLTTTLTGPTLTAFLALRTGVATSRNTIDLDRFKRTWREMLKNQVAIETVKFHPDASRDPARVSWHLSSKEIAALNTEWGPGTDPQGWRCNLRAEWQVLDRFLRGEPQQPREACP